MSASRTEDTDAAEGREALDRRSTRNEAGACHMSYRNCCAGSRSRGQTRCGRCSSATPARVDAIGFAALLSRRVRRGRRRIAVSQRFSQQEGRPRSWCGWYMRQRKGIADKSYNLARNWARWGRPTTPRSGAIVVWRSHVGEIVSYQGGCTATVHSGNDAGAVRTRERNICNAIAFRA